MTGGDLVCNAALTDSISDIIEVGSGRSLTFTQGWETQYRGTLNLDGSTADTYLYGGTFISHGAINLTADSHFHCDTRFESDTTVNMLDANDDLCTHANLYIEAGAEVNGPGELRPQSGTTCTLEDGVDIDAELFAYGNVVIEEGDTGTVTVSRFYMGSTASLLLEADGNGSSDLLVSDTDATLYGTLDIDFIDSYTPADGDSFTVLTYATLSGSFDDITWDGAFDLIPTYGINALTLLVSFGDGSTAVPEPSTWLLLASGVLLLVLRRNHK